MNRQFAARLKIALASESGSILVIGIGLMIVLVMLTTAAANLNSVWLGRQTLNELADGSAIAAAQAVEGTDVYEHGVGTRLTLDPRQARVKVRAYLKQASTDPRLTAVRMRSLRVEGHTVRVELQGRVALPFSYAMPSSIALIRAAAQATNIVDP